MEPNSYRPQPVQQTPNKGNFIRAMIKVNNPGWTEAQIESELAKKLKELENPQDNGGCEMCSG